MAVVTTLEGLIVVPDDTPGIICRALQVAASSRFCRFLTNLEKVNPIEFSIEATIGPAKSPLFSSSLPWYKVRFLIPCDFPYRTVQVIPLDPPLRWNPHQNGNWSTDLDPHANVICPPSLSDIYQEELLHPYIRHAYRWISDAIANKLISLEQRYEFPHLVQRSKKKWKVYIEGGSKAFSWVQTTKYGRAWLMKLAVPHVLEGLYRVDKLRCVGKNDDSKALESEIRNGVFGEEDFAGWAPWVFAGNPVVQSPHRPPLLWSDFSSEVQRNIFLALKDIKGYAHQVPILLVAFAVPKTWGGQPSNIVWKAVELLGFDPTSFDKPTQGSFRDDPRRWPKVQQFLVRNRDLQWIECVDVSTEALMARNGKSAIDISQMKIAILGVGAVGSILSKAISKLNPAELLLIDREVLEPGNFVRHEALPFQVEQPKSSAMASLLIPIQESSIVREKQWDIIHHWQETVELIKDFDLVIDATGDFGVHELVAQTSQLSKSRIVWCYIKPGPEFGVLVLRKPFSRLSLDLAEQRLQESVESSVWEHFESLENQNNQLVWPEPGCYHPTFNAPYHRLRMMTDSFLSVILDWLEAGSSANVATLFRQDRQDHKLGIENRIETQVRIEE